MLIKALIDLGETLFAPKRNGLTSSHLLISYVAVTTERFLSTTQVIRNFAVSPWLYDRIH